jgi:hypothetical protein
MPPLPGLGDSSEGGGRGHRRPANQRRPPAHPGPRPASRRRARVSSKHFSVHIAAPFRRPGPGGTSPTKGARTQMRWPERGTRPAPTGVVAVRQSTRRRAGRGRAARLRGVLRGGLPACRRPGPRPAGSPAGGRGRGPGRLRQGLGPLAADRRLRPARPGGDPPPRPPPLPAGGGPDRGRRPGGRARCPRTGPSWSGR